MVKRANEIFIYVFIATMIYSLSYSVTNLKINIINFLVAGIWENEAKLLKTTGGFD